MNRKIYILPCLRARAHVRHMSCDNNRMTVKFIELYDFYRALTPFIFIQWLASIFLLFQ